MSEAAKAADKRMERLEVTPNGAYQSLVGHSAAELDKQDVLEHNAGVDRAVVASYKQLERKLKQLGVEVRPRYTLDPPLGSGRPPCCST